MVEIRAPFHCLMLSLFGRKFEFLLAWNMKMLAGRGVAHAVFQKRVRAVSAAKRFIALIGFDVMKPKVVAG